MKTEVGTVSGETGNDVLLGVYPTGGESGPVDESELGSYLCDCLPSAMHPRMLIHAREVKLGANGKLDREAKVDCVLANARGERNADDPLRTENESTSAICELWNRLLGLDADCSINVTTGCFATVGSSLSATMLLAQLSQLPGSDLWIDENTPRPTASGLLEQLTHQQGPQ